MVTETIELAACADCLVWVANRDDSGMDDDERAETVRSKCHDLQTNEGVVLISEGEDLGFSWQACEICDGLAGDRYRMVAVPV